LQTGGLFQGSLIQEQTIVGNIRTCGIVVKARLHQKNCQQGDKAHLLLAFGDKERATPLKCFSMITAARVSAFTEAGCWVST